MLLKLNSVAVKITCFIDISMYYSCVQMSFFHQDKSVAGTDGTVITDFIKIAQPNIKGKSLWK